MADEARQKVEKDKQDLIDGVKNQIAAYKLQEEWGKAQSLFKTLADTLGDVDTLIEYADFCKEAGFADEARTYYQQALDKLSADDSIDNKEREDKKAGIATKIDNLKGESAN